MNYLKTEPMEKYSTQVQKEVSNQFAKAQDYEQASKALHGEPIIVYTTKDYHLFKSIDGNRDLNPLHYRRLKKSIEERHLITIVMVNEHMEIIDGHHRYTISKEMNLPINYIIAKGYGLKEVQKLNVNMKNWSINDYINGYCDLGLKDYIIYRDFVSFYGFPSQVSLLLLSDEHISGSDENNISLRFKEGTFVVKNLMKAKAYADKIISLKPYYKGYLRRSFILALHGMLNNKNFVFSEFLAKLKQQPTTLQDCVNVSQYKSLIEEIYNYRRREKINLRF